VVFDVAQAGYRSWSVVAFGIGFTAIGGWLIANRRWFPVRGPSWFRAGFPFVFFGFAFCWTGAAVSTTYLKYRNSTRPLRAHRLYWRRHRAPRDSSISSDERRARPASRKRPNKPLQPTRAQDRQIRRELWCRSRLGGRTLGRSRRGRSDDVPDRRSVAQCSKRQNPRLMPLMHWYAAWTRNRDRCHWIWMRASPSGLQRLRRRFPSYH
jgi:hypothetical protein